MRKGKEKEKEMLSDTNGVFKKGRTLLAKQPIHYLTNITHTNAENATGSIDQLGQ